MKCTNIHHIGLWVDDMDGMISFLTEVLGFRLLTRHPVSEGGPELEKTPGLAFKLAGPGERAFIHAGDNQLFELLAEPNVQPRPDFPVHPTGSVVGIPHVCLRVEDLPSLEERIESLGYPITTTAYAGPEKGYIDTGFGPLRAIWFTGPCGVGFEMFEFREEYPFEKPLEEAKS